MIKSVLVGETAILQHIHKLPDSLRARLSATIKQLGTSLQRTVRQDYLDGRALRRRSGRLGNSISQVTTIDGDRFTSIVATNVDYGVAWEEGFERKLGAGAHGGPRRAMGKAKAAYVIKHPSGTAHARRPFLAPALQAMEAKIKQDIDTALREAMP